MLPVGTVGYKGDTTLDLGDLADVGTIRVHFVELAAAHETDALSVGPPQRGAGGSIGGELDKIPSLDCFAPDVGGAAVGFHVHFCDGEERRFTIGRNYWRPYTLNLKQVIR